MTTNSVSLCSLFLHGHESEPAMWLLWPTEYCGRVAIPILSLVLKRTSSFYFLPLGVHPPCLKEAQATTQKGQQEGILRHLANSHNWTPSQQPASTLPGQWVSHFGSNSSSPVKPSDDFSLSCHLDCNFLTFFHTYILLTELKNSQSQAVKPALMKSY